MTHTDDILAELNTATTPADLSVELFAILADEIEEAIARGTKENLEDLKLQIANAFDRLMIVAPSDAAAVIQGQPLSEETGAFVRALSRLEFAYQLTAQVASRRAGTAALDLLNKSRFKPYLEALVRKEMTGVELAEQISQKPETVSRNLAILRESGLVDCRRDGTRLFNFLTPIAAESVENSEPNEAPSVIDKPTPRDRAIQKITNGLEPRFSRRPIISIKPQLNQPT
jgi:DNA-binding MarR family transcriptional regulator